MFTLTCKQCSQSFRAQKRRTAYCSIPCFHAYEADYAKRRRATFSLERKRASNLVFEAMQTGELRPKPCELCGAQPAVAHHDDYADALAVRWLCNSHHQQWHAANGPGANAFIEEAR